MLTILTHVLNEELLLPFWLRHHRQMFDHGIVMDFGSTDRSVAIIKELCPTWEIIKPWSEQPGAMDYQFMRIEEKIQGWKTILTVPEFLVIADLKKHIESLPSDQEGFKTDGFVIVESPDERTKPLTEENILLQRTWGYQEPKLSIKLRQRLIHRRPNGKYKAGRHWTEDEFPVDKTVPLAWLGLGLPEIKKRKNQGIREHYPNGTPWLCHHRWSDEQIEHNWKQEQLLCYDIPARHPTYKERLDEIRQRDNQPSGS